MSDHRCDHCPVPGSPCLLRDRGQCHEAAREAALRRRRPGAETPYTDRAVAHADRLAGLDRLWAAPDGRIRLGLVSPGLHPGGAERHMLALAEWLPSDRYQIAGVATYDPTPTETPISAAFDRLGVPIGRGEATIRSLYRSCDVAYVWGLPPERQCLDGPTCPIVLVAHGIGEWTVPCMATAGRADAVVVVAEEARLTLPEAERSRARRIYNAVDPARCQPARSREAVRAEWGIPPEAIVLGNCARVSREKGPHLVPSLMEALGPSDPARFVWVGGGPELGDLRRLAAESPRADAIRFPGHAEDVGSALAAFDWFVQPSLEDAHPLAMTEAMLAGVPIVATAHGVVAEWPELFRVVPKRPTADDLVAALRADRADPEGTAARVERARRFAEARLTPGRFVAEWSELLAGVVAARPAPPPRQVPRRRAPAVASDRGSNARACEHREKIPDDERVGCGCAHRCTAGRSRQADGGVTVNDCWECPLAPRRRAPSPADAP